jgi:hypothetical protein
MGITEAVVVIVRAIEEDAVDVVDTVQVIYAVDPVILEAIHPVQNITAMQDEICWARGPKDNIVHDDPGASLERKRKEFRRRR